MRLIKLTLRNFRGHESFTLEPEGKSLDIYGKNGIGKTTLADALTWLVTGKDSQDRSPGKFGIKTREVLPDGSLGEEIHDLEHAVEATFEMADGQMLTLKKVYTEVWTKPRSSNREELTSHTTDHYINDEPIKKAGEYADRLAEIITEEEYKMLSLPSYFPEIMHWQERRDVLANMAGEITEEDVIEANPDLERYPDILDGRSQDGTMAALKERKKNLNKELGTRENPGQLTTRINEAQSYIKELDKDPEEAQGKIARLKERKSKLEQELADIKSGGGVSEIRVKISDIEAEKSELRDKARKAAEEKLSGIREKISDREDMLDSAEEELREAQRQYKDIKSSLEDAEAEVERLEKKQAEEKAKEPKPEEEFEPGVCPMCERPMESDHDHEQYVAEFNEKKAQTLAQLKEDHANATSKVARLSEQLEEAEQAAIKTNGRVSQRQEAVDKARRELEAAKSDITDPEDSEEWEELTTRQEALQEKIEKLQSDRQSKVEEWENTIEEAEKEIEAEKAIIKQADANQQYRDNIEKYQEQRKKYSKELEQIEEDLYLIEEFKRTHASLIEDSVNDYFEHVHWQMFEYHLSGGISEVCNAVYKSKPFEILSTSEKIFAGMDIIRTLTDFIGKSVPIWIDNRESVTELPDSDLQVISLIVDPRFDRITVVPAGETPEVIEESEQRQPAIA